MRVMRSPDVTAFFDEATNTVTYVVADPDSGRAAIVDPVLDFTAASGRTSTRSADAVIEFVREREFSIDWLLETHVHADHLSGAPCLREALGGKIAIGEQVTAVQSTFRDIYNLADLATDGYLDLTRLVAGSLR